MELYVNVYEGLADRMNVILSPAKAEQEIREIFENNGWEGDPSEVEPDYTLELIEEDDDGTGLYGAHWQGYGRYREYVWLRPDPAGVYYDEASRWMDSDPRVDDLVDAIEGAESLDALADALNSLIDVDPDLRRQVEDEIDMTSSLPTFGGEEPDDTLEVWSWDETRLLVGASQPFRLVPR